MSVEADTEKEENLEGRKCFHTSALLEQSWGDSSRFEDMLSALLPAPFLILTSTFSQAVPASPAQLVD